VTGAWPEGVLATFSTWWAEQGMVLHTEFRDGNVPAGYEQLRVLKEALALLAPGAVWEVGGGALCDEGRFSRWQVAIG